MKKVYIFIVLVTLFSCEKNSNKDLLNKMNVNIINNTNSIIDSVIIYTETTAHDYCDTLIIVDIHPDTNKVVQWENIQTCNSSGEYLINVYLTDTILIQKAGNFTDGTTQEFLMFLNVNNESVLPGFGRHED